MGIAVVDKAVKIHPVGVIEHAGRLHDGLEPLEGRARHDRRGVPGVDVLVALHDLREHRHARVRKLRAMISAVCAASCSAIHFCARAMAFVKRCTMSAWSWIYACEAK